MGESWRLVPLGMKGGKVLDGAFSDLLTNVSFPNEAWALERRTICC